MRKVIPIWKVKGFIHLLINIHPTINYSVPTVYWIYGRGWEVKVRKTEVLSNPMDSVGEADVNVMQMSV